MPAAAGSLPAISAIASWAAALASSLTFLKTVMLCWPVTMFCRPSVPESWPVTTTWPLRPLLLSTPMTALAMSSFAASDAVDLAAGRGQRRREGRGRVGDEPALDDGLLLDGELAGRLQRVEHLVRALGEQHGVVVDVRAAVHHDDLRVVDALLR